MVPTLMHNVPLGIKKNRQVAKKDSRVKTVKIDKLRK
jgi:hypothetical protein